MTLESIDRAIFEKIRLRLVQLQLWPDITQYTTAAQIEAAKTALRATKGTIVEPYGVGRPKDRGAASDASIVIDRMPPRPGGLGASGYRFEAKMVDDKRVFDKYKHPDSSFDVEYEIRYICTQIAVSRVLDQMLLELFGNRGYFSPLANNGTPITDETFFMEAIGTQGGLASGMADVDERVYRYVVRDAWLVAETKVAENIPELLEVLPQIEAKKPSEI